MFPLSSHTAFAVRSAPPGPEWSRSSSRSIASRRPKSMSSSLNTAVPACCISLAASRLSSYVRVNLPVSVLKMCTLRSGRAMALKCRWSGDSVMDAAIVRVFLNWNRSVALLYCHIPGTAGTLHGSDGCQYSTKPASSAEMTTSNLDEYCCQLWRRTAKQSWPHHHEMHWRAVHLL